MTLGSTIIEGKEGIIQLLERGAEVKHYAQRNDYLYVLSQWSYRN